MDIVTSIFDAIASIVSGAVGVFVDLFSNDGIISVFWNSTESTLTVVGVIALVAFGFALVRWAFNFILKMLRMRG